MMAVGFSLLTAACILSFRAQIAGMYTSDPDVLLLTQHFLIYALFFSFPMLWPHLSRERSEDTKM